MTPTDDDIYLNNGETYQDTSYYADQPKDRIETEQASAAIKSASYPIMAEVADWFHEQAMAAMDIANIDLESKVPVEVQVKAFQLYQSKLIEKAREFEDWRSEKI